MSARRQWVISCDILTFETKNIVRCGNSYFVLGAARANVESHAKRDGWGFQEFGNQHAVFHVCPDHRKAFQLRADPDRFREVIVNGDYRNDHTVLLDCGHEFSKVEIGPDRMVECTACYLKWFRSGEIIGLPSIKDIVPEEE